MLRRIICYRRSEYYNITFLKILCAGIEHLGGCLHIHFFNSRIRSMERRRPFHHNYAATFICKFFCQSNTHFTRRMIADEAYRINRFLRWAGGDEDFEHKAKVKKECDNM